MALSLIAAACSGDPGEREPSTKIGDVVKRTTVVGRGAGEYATYRIPVLVRAPNGDLLLFAEGRNSKSDYGDVDIVLFRSRNEGATWSAGTVVADNGIDTASDMAAVVREDRIHLLYQKRPGDRTFSDYRQEEADDARAYHIYSDDNGKTWSAPADITRQILPAPDEQLPMFGPNNGIVLNSGRLVVPMYYANQSAEAWTPAVIYSDDRGETWRRSADVAPGQDVNETAVVQAPNGDVYGIARDNSGDENGTKRFFRSTDGGETWTETGDVQPMVPEVSCQQSMVSRGRQILLATPEKRIRKDGRLKAGVYDPSQSDNVDWVNQDLQVTPGGFAYSSMSIQDSVIHMAYERKTGDQYASLKYVQVNLSRLRLE